jgi:hypothetical protein
VLLKDDIPRDNVPNFDEKVHNRDGVLGGCHLLSVE